MKKQIKLKLRNNKENYCCNSMHSNRKVLKEIFDEVEKDKEVQRNEN